MEKEFTSLIAEHEKIILKVCNVYCKEPEDREDLFQDILIQLWKAFPTFEHRSKVTTWIYRVALNTAISRFRRQHRQPRRETISEKLIIEDTGPEQEEADRLYEAIGQLDALNKGIVLLYLEGAQYSEIGEVMGLSESNVGFKLNRIRRKLRELLKKENQ